MPGGPFQKWKHREVAVGIGGHIHVEVVTEEIAFPMRVPAPVTVRLGIMAFASAGSAAVFLTIAVPLFALLCGSPDRSTVTGKSQMVWIDQSLLDRTNQELLLIKPENKGKRIFRFQFPAFQQREKPGSRTGRVTRGLIAFLFPFGGFILGKRSFVERLLEVSCQMREKKS